MSVPLSTLLGGFGRDGHGRGAGSLAILRREILAGRRNISPAKFAVWEVRAAPRRPHRTGPFRPSVSVFLMPPVDLARDTESDRAIGLLQIHPRRLLVNISRHSTCYTKISVVSI